MYLFIMPNYLLYKKTANCAELNLNFSCSTIPESYNLLRVTYIHYITQCCIVLHNDDITALLIHYRL